MRSVISSFERWPYYSIALSSFIAFLAGCRDKPTQPDLTVGLEITAPARSIYSGGSLQLAAIAKLSSGNTEEVTAYVRWSLQPGRAGRVNESGLFVATTNVTGTETVRADYKGQSAVTSIEVTKHAISLAIWPMNAKVEAGRTLQFEAIAEFQDASQEYVTAKAAWAVAPGIAATIDSAGRLRAKPGMLGNEAVTGNFQTLATTSRIEVQTQFTSLLELANIPAGNFIMGDDNGRSNEKPAHEVFIDAFAIGRYEVTNAQYVAYLNQALAAGEIFTESGLITAKRGPFAGIIYGRMLGSFEFPEVFIEAVEIEPGELEFRVKPGYENYPVVRLNWYGAAAFCAFYGFRLPTEAEWEKACRGGQQLASGTQDGNINHDLANYQGREGRDQFMGLAPVGSFPPNPYGLFDMCGNAAEFVNDLYDAAYYANSPKQNPLGPGPAMVLGTLPGGLALWRGGAWIHSSQFCRAAFRGTILDQADHNLLGEAFAGFRVARTLP
jgi:formylglycine-generating enzyme required for sulfatase activity